MSRRKEREHSSGADYGADSTRLQQRRSRGLSESGRLDDQQTTGARKERERREKMEPSSNRKEPGRVYQTTINDQETSKHPKSHST